MLFGIGHYGYERDLAARSRRRGHGDERRKAALEDFRSLERREIDALGGKGSGGTLGRVDNRTAPQRDEPVAALFVVQCCDFVYHVHRRIGRYAVVYLVGYVCGRELVEQVVGNMQLHEALIGHDEGLGDALVAELVGDLGERPFAAYYLRGTGKLETFHDILLLAGACDGLVAVGAAPEEERAEQRREQIGERYAGVVGPARRERSFGEGVLERFAA